jgi:hypothetical protein
VNGTRKQTKKEDTNKLTALAFEMIPILHNTLLATPKLKFYSGAFAHFWGSPNPAITIVMGPNSNFTLGEFVLLGSLPNSNFTRGFCPFWGSGAQNQILLWGHLFFWGGSKTQILLRGFCPFWGPLGHFGVQGPKIKFDFGGFYPSLGCRTQILLGDFAHLWGPKLKFYSGAFSHFWGPPNQNE